ncbi:error-prone DNA polymerase [Candidatus Laterigemmans baculatus]|uniref:error-prone DNA polymerase n=1 Tax=Candidatus Laterigemmans baculatus TaxID=2770505 RepID=UPI0013D9D656|nr:error-prone DNA polymerase [Candidatus Laterigemmans baculatus]
MRYVELHCKTNFTFLQGASHPDELVERAAQLGYAGLAITDQASLAGVVRAWGPAKEHALKLIIGTELAPLDGPPLVLWATDRGSYGRLCRLISRGRLRCEKGAAEIRWDDIAELGAGLLAGVCSGAGGTGGAGGSGGATGSQAAVELTATQLGKFRDTFGDRGYLLCELLRGVDDAGQLQRMRELSLRTAVPLVAAGDVHYHRSERMLMHDCVTAIRNGTTIDRVHRERFANSQRHLRTLPQIAHIYREATDLIARTVEIADRCTFRLDELRYEYPEELVPEGKTPIEHLKRLAWEGARQRWPEEVPEKIIEALRHEFELIEALRYEAYFLTVWDMVRFARSRNILCQGRGSAANSVVCYCLGVTSVDPSSTDLLFERFISRERDEAPDIDVDFEHERREEVLQYLYEKYGRSRAGMTATVTTYRAKSAVREAGKALGASPDAIDRLAKISESYSRQIDLRERCVEAGIDPESELSRRWLYLIENLVGFPRHLSQHVGGMVMTAGPLCELCPIENAAMEGRTVIQWDKDDLEELGILKVDCLSLGMLSAIHRTFDLVEKHHHRSLSLATIPQDDKPTYEMICRADTMGVFQIESRAQMSMLPRLQPRCYYDLVIEIAIVRPGPIQGQMVHPFLRARENPAAVEYPSPEIRQVLEKTLGVPIFQEQAMRLAVVAAGFTPGEADQLRRAMAAWRRPGVIDRFRIKLLEGMRAGGLSEAFAEQVFHQIRGFGEYGFPESHAASFALLVYASAYLKRHYPAAFCAALLNSQPMGFYAPAQLIGDARRQGVEVRPPDVNASDWDCTLEESGRASPAIRLGLRMIRGLAQGDAERILEARGQAGCAAEESVEGSAQRSGKRGAGRFESLAELARRTRLGQATLARLADADALGSLAADRRAALWETLAQERRPREMPLLEGLDAGEGLEGAEGLEGLDAGEGGDWGAAVPATGEGPWQGLPAMSPLEEVYADYHTTGLSLRGHPLQFCREQLREMRCVSAAELPAKRHGRRVRVAGLVLLRQRPGTAKGITFVTLEDETGTVNLVLYPAVWQRFSSVTRASNAWLVEGQLENRRGVIHVVAGRVEDLSSRVEGLVIRSRDFH